MTTVQASASVEKLVATAVEYGVAQDQLMRFMEAGYFPLPHQLKFHGYARQADKYGAVDILQGGGRGGAKSHALFAQIALDDCQRRAGLRTLILRKSGKAAKEQVNALREKLLLHISHQYREREGYFKFPNGSSIQIGHYRKPSDIDEYLGIEYDIISIEEVVTLPTEYRQKALGSRRTSRNDWRPRSYYATNPGGVSHGDLRREFYLPWKHKKESETRYVHSTYEDNPFVDAGYQIYLEKLSGTLGKFWRDGDWDAVAGAYFSHFDSDLHIKPFSPKTFGNSGQMYLSYDHGYSHYAVAHLHAKYDGKCYTIDEFSAQKWLVPDIADGINEMLDRWERPIHTLSAAVAGHDIFAMRGGERDGLTIAAQFEQKNLPFVRANIARIAGASHMLTLLGNPEVPREPNWFISEECPGLIETLPMLASDPARPEDVKKWDVSGSSDDGDLLGGYSGDDFYDSARYGLMAIGRMELARVRGYGRRGRRPARSMVRR